MTPDLSYELEGERKKMGEDNKWDEKKINTTIWPKYTITSFF